VVSLPWDWTNLPTLLRTQKDDVSDDELVALLSPLAVQDLIRWIRQRRQPTGARDENVIKHLQK